MLSSALRGRIRGHIGSNVQTGTPHSQSTRDGANGSPPFDASQHDPDEPNYYELLNVPYTASKTEITAAYRQAMRRAHPDRAAPQRREAAETLAKLINAAYATLNDPAKRLVYDRTIRAQEVQDQIMKRYVGGFAGPGAGNLDPSARNLKRELTPSERRERRNSERSAIVSVFSVFLVLVLGVIGLLVLGTLVSWGWSQIF